MQAEIQFSLFIIADNNYSTSRWQIWQLSQTEEPKTEEPVLRWIQGTDQGMSVVLMLAELADGALCSALCGQLRVQTKNGIPQISSRAGMIKCESIFVTSYSLSEDCLLASLVLATV